jgi:transposase, IS5 family
MGQQGFWDIEERQEKLAQKQPLLSQLNDLVPWEIFRSRLEGARQKERKSNAGRKPIDVILLFKMVILQQLYNISDEGLEYQVNDRISFMEFLGIGIEDKVPDATSVWLFKECLQKQGLVEELFEEFGGYLQEQGYQAKGGQIIDATLVPVPKQHNSKKENEKIKAGEEPEGWKEKPNKRSQKDQDARWTKKNDVSHFGYKNHICIDVEYKFIRTYEVSDASVHDSKILGQVLDGENESDKIWADSAYRSTTIESILEDMKFESHIHERGYRNNPLTESQKEDNREKSQTRARVEHVFGAFVNEMGGKLLRTIGIGRAKAHLGLKNLTYNFKRFVFLELNISSI